MPPGTLGGPPLKTRHSSVDGERPCEGCGLRINDRYLLSVGESLWHEQCVACAACGVMLTNSCYWRNSKLYCKDDYDRYVFSMKKVPICLKARLTKKGGADVDIKNSHLHAKVRTSVSYLRSPGFVFCSFRVGAMQRRGNAFLYAWVYSFFIFNAEWRIQSEILLKVALHKRKWKAWKEREALKRIFTWVNTSSL
jgi:LIM domain